MCSLITVTTPVVPLWRYCVGSRERMSAPREQHVIFEKREENQGSGRDARQTNYDVQEVVNQLHLVLFSGDDVKMFLT